MLYVAIWYVSIRYEGEGRTASNSSFTLITYRDIPNCNIEHKNAPEDGLLESEIC